MPNIEGIETEKRFVTTDHFEAMLSHVSIAKFPDDLGIEPADWWDAL